MQACSLAGLPALERCAALIYQQTRRAPREQVTELMRPLGGGVRARPRAVAEAPPATLEERWAADARARPAADASGSPVRGALS
jgi:hypothetical protein